MRAALVLAGAAVAVVLVNAALSARRTWGVIGVGLPAPAFQLASLDGHDASLARYKGKLLLVNFWSSSCPVCRGELPTLEAAYRRHRADGFEVLAPALEDRRSLTAFVAGRQETFAVAPADPKTAAVYGVSAVPTSFLISPDGKILKRYFGAIEPAELENDVVGNLPRLRAAAR